MAVELSVRSELQRVINELEALKAKATEVNTSFKETGDAVGEGLHNNVKKTENFFSSLRSLSRRVADQLRGDFKSLVSINALTDAMKLSNQFRQSVSETVQLSDTIRKLGATFGIAQDQFANFQTRMTEGLGEIGMASDVAAEALKGLSTTPVRGAENLLAYAKSAGMLASISGEKGREGDIAKGLASVTQARGGNVNDAGQMNKLAESLRRVFVQTGASPTDTLRTMQQIFANMPQDMRKAITDAGLANLAAASQVGGPNATKFLEEYLGKSPIARMAFDAQGGKGIMTEKGIDTDKFSKFFKDITARVGGDPRLAAQTLGLSEEAAEGFVRLGENLDKVQEAQKRVSEATGDLNEQYRSSMGLGESFRANINKVKSALAAPFASATQGATNIMSGASQTGAGAAAVVGGAALGAAALSGLALKGIGGGLGGGLAKGVGAMGGTFARKEAAEEMLGAKTVPVYVVNADEIGGGGPGGALGGLGAAGGTGAAAATAGGLSLAGVLALLSPLLTSSDSGDNSAQAERKKKRKMESEYIVNYEQNRSPEQISALKQQLSKGEVAEKDIPKAWKILDALSAQPEKVLAPPQGAGQNLGVSGQPGGVVRSPGAAGGANPATQTVKHVLQFNDPRLKESKQPNRGASN